MHFHQSRKRKYALDVGQALGGSAYGEERHGRAEHVQGSWGEAELQRHSEEARHGQAHGREVLVGGGGPPNRRSERESAFERVRDIAAEKAALPGMTKRAVYEFLLHMHNDPPLPGYGAFTAWCRRTGLVFGAAAPGEDDRRPARVSALDVQGPRRRARGTRHRQHVGARLPLGRQEAQDRAGVEVRRRGRVPPGPVRAPEPRDQGQG